MEAKQLFHKLDNELYKHDYSNNAHIFYMSSFKEHEKITEVLRDRFARYSTSNYKMDNWCYHIHIEGLNYWARWPD